MTLIVIFLSTTYTTTARSNCLAHWKEIGKHGAADTQAFQSFRMVSSMAPADLQSLCTTLATLQSGYYRNQQQHRAWCSSIEGYSWFYWLDLFRKSKQKKHKRPGWFGVKEDLGETRQVNKSILTYRTRCDFCQGFRYSSMWILFILKGHISIFSPPHPPSPKALFFHNSALMRIIRFI